VTRRPPVNVGASISHRLRNLAREKRRPIDEIRQYYALERFLYRLSVSRHRDRFVLKGALMMRVWDGEISRPTRDIDLLGRSGGDQEELEQIFRDVCRAPCVEDGMTYDPDTVRGGPITGQQEYPGVRIDVIGRLDTARPRFHVDVGFGDVVVPSPLEADYPTLLDLPAPHLSGYTRESLIAEKFEAMLRYGELNSRLKDYYDIWLLSRTNEIDASSLLDAVRATLERRGTRVDSSPPALTGEFAEPKQPDWQAFRKRTDLSGAPEQLTEVVAALASFFEPIVEAVSSGAGLPLRWSPGRGWQER
jgi:predicted nucleotidyltransferase component of viral defense system